MNTITGKPVCGGIAFGKLELIKNETSCVQRIRVNDTKKETERFEAALLTAKKELDDLYKKALLEVGEENAMIFDIHQMMLNDVDFLDSIKSNITNQKLNAESAVAMTADNFAQMFSSMDDSYMQARASDVKDISERLISILSNKKSTSVTSGGNVIIGALDLAPSQTVQLDKSKILAFITEEGSNNSHTSILARTMNIPAIIGAKGILDDSFNGCDVIADGYSGKIYINPDMSTVLKMQEKKLKSEEKMLLLSKLKGVKPVTKDGKEILLYANIGSEDDLVSVYENDAMGVGLFRSEFIYLERKNYPTEDEQFSVYKNVAQKALGKRVIIRTLDIGADKQVDYFDMPEEENPAMGVRAIRICLARPLVFKTQLRALLRASAYGKIAIMFPMITSVGEIKKIKEILEEEKDDLRKDSIPFNEDIEIGIMIETPAAAIISDLLAKEVDFFSIGTNDLTQYTLAIDRQNDAANAFCDVHHTAILRLIKTTVENAHKNKIWAGICGELAADLNLTETFLAMGVDELSVSPSLILPLKQKILDVNISKIKDDILQSLY
ncbi:MAG: phosphoenolpyruvate--protein phosphotransferase [Ruminococcaceae bacterium]|nr:phosphoenolpyruvate--protein phosphotransferase [Oscillospiraceae bacterium]